MTLQPTTQDAAQNLADQPTDQPAGTPQGAGQASGDDPPQVTEVKVSGEGNGLVDDETSGGARILASDKPPGAGKTANEANGGEGDQDATSQ